MAEELAGFKHRFVAGGEQGGATLLLLHGTGGNENDLLPLGRELLPSANLLSPRGKVLEHGRPRFFRRFAEGVFDEEDLKFRTEELAGFVGEASKKYRLEPSKLFAVGFSNGANIAASLLLSRPDLLRGAALLRPMVPFEPRPNGGSLRRCIAKRPVSGKRGSWTCRGRTGERLHGRGVRTM
jgi:phospholipase/carboxylesterase